MYDHDDNMLQNSGNKFTHTPIHPRQGQNQQDQKGFSLDHRAPKYNYQIRITKHLWRDVMAQIWPFCFLLSIYWTYPS